MPSRLEQWKIPTASLQRSKTTTTNECPGYDIKQSDGEVPVMLKLLRMQGTSSFSCLHWPKVVTLDRVLSMGQIELNWVLMLKWIAWNRTVLIFELRFYAKLNCLEWNCFCMLNWIVWNWTVFWYFTVCKQKNFTYSKLNCSK